MGPRGTSELPGLVDTHSVTAAVVAPRMVHVSEPSRHTCYTCD